MTLSGKARLVANSVQWRVKRRFDRQHKEHVASVQRLGTELSTSPLKHDHTAPEQWAGVVDRYELADGLSGSSSIALTWFDQGENYGDLLSPWLLGRMTGLPVTFAGRRERHVVMIGSIVSEATSTSQVWGSGSYGTERRGVFAPRARYHAVRGPLTRSRLLNVGIDCPRVYGDPALLTPLWFNPPVEKKYRVGLVIRHTEDVWRRLPLGEGVRIIDLRTTDVERTTVEMLECENIVSSSLHGLIIADAYGIPNAWLESDSAAGGSRPFGGEFKFYDYFASVDKLRHAQSFAVQPEGLSADHLLGALEFDGRPITFDPVALLDRAPFLRAR